MPTIISHPVVAVSLAPLFGRWGLSSRAWVFGAVCSVVSDVDVIGFRFGIRYSDALGHRGFTHSVFFAIVWSALLVAFFRRGNLRAQPPGALFVYFALSTLSHGLFDALTDGGLGVAFFAPFSNRRYFFPWRPIEVSPIGVGYFFTGDTGGVLASELAWVWLPSLVFAVMCSAFLAGRRNGQD